MNKETCKNCGSWKGIHGAHDLLCPANGTDDGEYLSNQSYEEYKPEAIENLTIRDVFACFALTGFLVGKWDDNSPKFIYEIADAMIKERSKNDN